MKKLTFEIRSPAHQQNAIHAVQQILPDPTKPIVVIIQERKANTTSAIKARNTEKTFSKSFANSS